MLFSSIKIKTMITTKRTENQTILTIISKHEIKTTIIFQEKIPILIIVSAEC